MAVNVTLFHQSKNYKRFPILWWQFFKGIVLLFREQEPRSRQHHFLLRAYLFTFTMSTGKKITYVGHLVFFKMLTFLVKQIGITLRQTLTYPTALSLTTDQNST